MPHGPEIPHLQEIVVLLLATVIGVPLLRRLKGSPVLGYLIAGIAIGPFGLGLVSDVAGVRTLAEFGVVFLLFAIGLELSLQRLWAMRRAVFGLGTAQLAATAAIIGGTAYLWGNAVKVSIVLGLCLALSSTAIVMQLLVERNEVASRVGRLCFGVLLLQDLAVVPILLLVSALSASDQGSLLISIGSAVGRAAAAIAIIYTAGRVLLRPLFRLVSLRESPEVFTAMTLLAIIVIASGTAMAGLSMALGAFLAGLLLSQTEFRHQVEIDIEPFKGLLLGLFFMSIGMAIDFAVVADWGIEIAYSVVGLIAIKFAVAASLAALTGQPAPVAISAGFHLAQAGEFAFVVVGAAVAAGLIEAPIANFMLIVAGLTMLLTPLVTALGVRLARHVDHRRATRTLGVAADDVAQLDQHVVILGFGRFGATVARLLDAQQVSYLAVDRDPARVADCRGNDIPIFFGDAGRPDILSRLGLDRAAAVVVTLDDPKAAADAVRGIRARAPGLDIYGRARDLVHMEALCALGAKTVVPENVEASLQIGGQVLQGLGTPPNVVGQIVDGFREQDYAAASSRQ